MSNKNIIKENSNEDEQYNGIKKLLKEKNLNPKNLDDLTYLLSLTLKPTIKHLNLEYLIYFLLKEFNPKNESIFYEYFFHSCELGKVNYVKILLENGLSVNCQNDLGETPLHIAISKNDINLINLLIKYEPDTGLSTDKDNLTAMSYAKIQGNENIIKIINDLNEKNKKELIRSEIIEYINKDMNNIDKMDRSDISSFINKNNNFDEIQNYNGEKMSILITEDANNNILNNKNIGINKKRKKNNNINNIYCYNTNTQTVINESDFYEGDFPKNNIKINNDINNINNDSNNNGITSNENHQRFFTEECNCDIKISKQFTTDLKCYTSPLKDKCELLNIYNNASNNPSCGQSLTTSNSINKELYYSPLSSNKATKTFGKKIELNNFMLEINLPKIYANYLLDNGFDDLEVLISQAKNGTALSDQNLKDIGIKLPGDRAKILVHLEELAGNFPFFLEKNIIYSNEIKENNSLYKFLTSINFEEYIKTFNDNGYYNAEILYIQMESRSPITEEILKNDFGINKIGHIKRIMLNLINLSKNYIKRLKNRNKDNNSYKSIVFEGNPYTRACEACNLFNVFNL